jgi:LysM repeat protein
MMSRKAIPQAIVLAVILVASLSSPGDARASSGCGSTYVVQWGDTLSAIADRCGTTVSALYAANPGISAYLYAGQVLAIPGSGYVNYPSYGYANVYIVQRGDTFSGIARRYGLTVNQLWAANPQIWDINRIYPGQAIYIPYGSYYGTVPSSQEPLVARSTDGVPEGTPTVKVRLVNAANAEVYVSLQGTTKDGIKVINEYPVSGAMSVKVPAGWYVYVAWVGGQKFAGQFNMRAASNPTITFYINRVVVE